MKKHEWEIQQKRKVIRYKKMMLKRRLEEPDAIQSARKRLYDLFEPMQVKIKREK